MKSTHPPIANTQPGAQAGVDNQAFAAHSATKMAVGERFFEQPVFQKCRSKILSLLLVLGCGSVASAQLTVDFVIMPPTCAGYTDGSVQAQPQGGSAPYQFHWSNNQGGQGIYGLTGGTFSLTVTDATGATVTGSATVTPPDPVVAKINPDFGVCAGNTGTYTALGDGGMAPYSFAWSNGATSQTISTQDTGYFFVTVTDANGCFDVAGYQIFDKLSVDVVTKNSTCFGVCDGSATAYIHGGVKPYKYLWNTGSNEAAIFPLPPGIYTVSVTDSLGCTATGTGIVLEPPPTFLDLQVDGECTGNGSATITASGGTPPFQYLWSTGSTETSVSNLSEGYYFVTVTDSLNCKVDTQVVISNGAVLVIAGKDDATCLGLDDGSALAAAPSGIGPLSFQWSDGQTTIAADSLAPGTYGLTLTDAAGCKDSTSVEIGADIVIEVDGVGTEAGCNDAKLGTATLTTILGGNPPYSYLWNDSLAQTSLTATGLGNGTYVVEVTDNIGCKAFLDVLVPESQPLALLIGVDNAKCQNTLDGHASVFQVSQNGLPPFVYVWNTGDSTASLSNVLAGSYSVTVSDARECTGTVPVNISSDASVEALFASDFQECLGDSVKLNFDEVSTFAPAGSPIVSWEWIFDNGLPQNSTQQDVTVFVEDSTLLATLIVEGSTGCRDTLTQSLEFENIIHVQLPGVSTACLSDTLSLMPVFDLEDSLSFTWSSASPFVSFFSTNEAGAMLVAADTGIFILHLMLENPLGCTAHQEVAVQFLPEHVAFDPSLVSYRQCDDLTLEFENANPGSEGVFTWYFNFPDTSASSAALNPSFTYSDTGSYVVAFVPALPCLQDTFYLTVQVAPAAVAAFSMDKSACSDTVTVSFTDQSQTPGNIVSWEWHFGTGDSSSLQNPSLVFTQSDTVQATLEIQFETGCLLTVTEEFNVFVFNPDFLPDTIHACPGEATVELNPGGDSTYQYQWSPVANLDDPNDWNPAATVSGTTTYVVTITDQSQTDFCSADKTVTVTVTNEIGLQVPPDAEACRPTDDTLTVSAAKFPVAFLWSSQVNFTDTMSQEASMIVQLATPTTYFVQATDEFGCKESDSVQVGAYPVRGQLLDSEKVCKGNLPEVTISDLQADESVTWQPYDPESQPLEETATFIATFVNSHGCTLTDTVKLVSVDQNKEFSVVPALDTIILGGSTLLQVLSENNNHVCFWSPETSLDDPGDCEVVASPLESTTYTVIVEDLETGCRGTGTASVCVVSNLCEEPMIYVPNSFTPNGDGLNDLLFVRGYNVERVLVFAIYNRWGEKVFETTDQNEGWDGAYANKEGTGDVFVYYLKVECKSGEEFFTKGNVTVLK